MGSPTTNILSEIFLQKLEVRHFYKLIKNHNKKLLALYVGFIIIICDSTNTNEVHILEDLNNIHNKIQFTLE